MRNARLPLALLFVVGALPVQAQAFPVKEIVSGGYLAGKGSAERGGFSSTGTLANKAPGQQDAQTLERLIRRYSTDRDSLRSFYNIPFSENTLKRHEAFLSEKLKELRGTPYQRLSQEEQVEYVLLRNQIEKEMAAVSFNRRRYAETQELTPFAPTIVALEENRWRIEPVDYAQVAGELTKLANEVEQVRRRLQLGLDKKPATETDKPLSVSPEVALRASGVVSGLRSALDRWFRHYDGFNPMFSWWNRKPYESANRAMTEYERFLRERIASTRGQDDDPLIGDPIGRGQILEDLRHEMIAYTPEELVQIARREFEWCEREMLRASREMGFGDNWRAALEKVKQNHVEPGKQDDLVALQAREAIEFLERLNLVTIEPLAAETWRVDMIDERGQRTLPFAAYGGQRMLVAYPLETMDHETKLMSLRGNNVHFSRIVTPHELIPGHHLQGYMAQRYRDHRRLFSTPFYGEGWALHWEMLLWDLDYPRGPEDRIGMLFWRMHRCARIIVSLGYHLGDMTPQEMIDFLVDRVGHERFTATSEVRRYIGSAYSPLYQVAYMIGGLQIREMYRELVGEPTEKGHLARPRKMTAREFHDAVLKENSIPIELLRAALTGQKLSPEHTASWRFYRQQ